MTIKPDFIDEIASTCYGSFYVGGSDSSYVTFGSNDPQYIWDLTSNLPPPIGDFSAWLNDIPSFSSRSIGKHFSNASDAPILRRIEWERKLGKTMLMYHVPLLKRFEFIPNLGFAEPHYIYSRWVGAQSRDFMLVGDKKSTQNLVNHFLENPQDIGEVITGLISTGKCPEDVFHYLPLEKMVLLCGNFYKRFNELMLYDKNRKPKKMIIPINH